MSLKAKGLISFLLSLPEDWRIYKRTLPDYFSDGRDAITTAWNELVELGYIISVRRINTEGLTYGWNHMVYNYPVNTQRDAEKPKLDKNENNKVSQTKKPVLEEFNEKRENGRPLSGDSGTRTSVNPPLQRKIYTKKEFNKERYYKGKNFKKNVNEKIIPADKFSKSQSCSGASASS